MDEGVCSDTVGVVGLGIDLSMKKCALMKQFPGEMEN